MDIERDILIGDLIIGECIKNAETRKDLQGVFRHRRTGRSTL